ncbi:hypothetical protein DFH09DRAFT_1410005 [Mycena vulgaris]|nr:hypothetical protein DFH09DRAFT_1410005 [Mycena vulgaris]
MDLEDGYPDSTHPESQSRPGRKWPVKMTKDSARDGEAIRVTVGIPGATEIRTRSLVESSSRLPLKPPRNVSPVLTEVMSKGDREPSPVVALRTIAKLISSMDLRWAAISRFTVFPWPALGFAQSFNTYGHGFISGGGKEALPGLFIQGDYNPALGVNTSSTSLGIHAPIAEGSLPGVRMAIIMAANASRLSEYIDALAMCIYQVRTSPASCAYYEASELLLSQLSATAPSPDVPLVSAMRSVSSTSVLDAAAGDLTNQMACMVLADLPKERLEPYRGALTRLATHPTEAEAKTGVSERSQEILQFLDASQAWFLCNKLDFMAFRSLDLLVHSAEEMWPFVPRLLECLRKMQLATVGRLRWIPFVSCFGRAKTGSGRVIYSWTGDGVKVERIAQRPTQTEVENEAVESANDLLNEMDHWADRAKISVQLCQYLNQKLEKECKERQALGSAQRRVPIATLSKDCIRWTQQASRRLMGGRYYSVRWTV